MYQFWAWGFTVYKTNIIYLIQHDTNLKFKTFLVGGGEENTHTHRVLPLFYADIILILSMTMFLDTELFPILLLFVNHMEMSKLYHPHVVIALLDYSKTCKHQFLCVLPFFLSNEGVYISALHNLGIEHITSKEIAEFLTIKLFPV